MIGVASRPNLRRAVGNLVHERSADNEHEARRERQRPNRPPRGSREAKRPQGPLRRGSSRDRGRRRGRRRKGAAGAQIGGRALVLQHRAARAQRLAHHPFRPHPRMARRTGAQVRLDDQPIEGGDLAVDVRRHEGVDFLASHCSLCAGAPPPASAPSRPAALGSGCCDFHAAATAASGPLCAERSNSRRRPREIRDITVPTGIEQAGDLAYKTLPRPVTTAWRKVSGSAPTALLQVGMSVR